MYYILECSSINKRKKEKKKEKINKFRKFYDAISYVYPLYAIGLMLSGPIELNTNILRII